MDNKYTTTVSEYLESISDTEYDIEIYYDTDIIHPVITGNQISIWEADNYLMFYIKEIKKRKKENGRLLVRLFV